MTDQDKLTNLLKEFDIEYKFICEDDANIIQCKEGNKNVTGYPFFFTDFNFTIEGEFRSMGVWE